MAYSTFQSVTGPTGPEGVKAVGVIGVDGNTGPTGDTGPNSPHLIEYEYPYNNNQGKAKLVFSDLSFVVIDAVTGPNAFPTREQDRPTNQRTTDGLGSYIGLTAGAENIGSSGRVFVSQSDGPGTGTTFQFRGLTAGGDLQLYVTDTEIYIGGTGGITSGYVDRGATGEFLHLDPRWKAQGGYGTFFGASGDNTGTGDSIKVKFRNVIDEVTDEFDSAFCGKVFKVGELGNDNLREYILDVSSICRYVDGDGITYGNLCISVTTENQEDRIVLLRTKHPNTTITEKLKYPLWGATEINFDDPLSGTVSFSDEGYGDEETRRDIVNFNTPYINASEGYFSGDGFESNVHPQTWNVADSGDPIPCPSDSDTDQGQHPTIIYDSGCRSNDDFIGAKFRGKDFCTAGPLKIAGYTAASYCLRITQDMFESENTLDPWYGKIRMVVMPSCGEDQVDLKPEYGFQIGCKSVCGCDHTETQCCTNTCGSATTSIETVTGRINLDITNTNFFQVQAPFQIAGITWSYEQRPGLSLAADDGLDYAEMKNITIVVEGGPENIAFPDNVFFAGKPTFTSGIDIVNLASIDNGETWYATMTGYGWDVDVFKTSNLGSCCNNLNCVDFVSEEYCDRLGDGGSFELNVACANRTDDVCGAGEQGACCTGVGETTIEYVCDDSDGPVKDNCYCVDNPDDPDCQQIDGGTIDCPDQNPVCQSWACFGECGSEANPLSCCPDGDCGVCTQELGSCCLYDASIPDGGHVCVNISDSCQRDQCNFLDGGYIPGVVCADRGSPILPPSSPNAGEPDFCFTGGNSKKCCQDCSVDGACLTIYGNLPDDITSVICPGGIKDDCADCEGVVLNTVARPICLTPATALSCNLINGYFVPESSVIPPQTPCDICDGLDACQPFEFGTCCNEFSGECFGITTKVQCDVFSGEWTPNVEDCDICCPQKEYRGACCLCVDQCIDDITPQQCSAVGGLFMGDESQCESVSCYQAGECPCDCVEDDCCDCPPGHPNRSPCCDPDAGNDCCDGDDCCGDPPGCGCNGPVDCCEETGQPPGPDGCDDDDDDDDGIKPERDSDGFDFAGFGGFGGVGGGGGGGGIDPRSDWLTGSCCFFGGNCYDGSFIVSRNNSAYNPNTNTGCKGKFSTDPCFMSGCPKTKFIGACCCMYWTLFCPNNDVFSTSNANSCEDCIVDDIKITCSNCDFDGDIPGWNRPWDGRSGPYKPSQYPNDVFDPTDHKVRESGRPYVTPQGLELPYRWQDCCKNPGGCKAKPCPMEDRVKLEELGVFYHKTEQCGDGGGFPSACSNNLNDITDWCNIVDGNTTEPAACVDPVREAESVCGQCDKQTICEQDGRPCDPFKNNTTKATAGTLDDISELTACEGCNCLPPPTFSTCPDGPCEQYVFSSCRFIHDRTKAPKGFGSDQVGSSCQGTQPASSPIGVPATGGNGLGSNSTASSGGGNGVCKDRAAEVWGPAIKDPRVPSEWNNPFTTNNPGIPRLPAGGRDFRRINTDVKILITQRDNVYEMRFI